MVKCPLQVRKVVENEMFDAIVSYRDDSDLRDAVNVAQRTVSGFSEDLDI